MFIWDVDQFSYVIFNMMDVANFAHNSKIEV